MAGTSSPTSSSSSSCLSIGSFVDDVPIKSTTTTTIKFLCSYGGRILPRCTDGKLRYVGGDTRVLSVDRSVSFPDLVAKMGELCWRGAAVGLRCQMPTEDLDALVSITSDEDLASLVEEYDLAGGGGGGGAHAPKIRAFLHHHHPSPPPSKGKSASASASASRPPVPTTAHRCTVHRGRAASVAVRPGHGSHRVQHHHQHHQHQFPVLHHLQQ